MQTKNVEQLIQASRQALLSGEDFRASLQDGATPLTLAIESGSEEQVKLALENGADPRVSDGRGFYPLVMVVARDKIVVVRMLIDSGVNVNHPVNPLGNVRSEQMLNLLIAEGADVNYQDEDGYTALHTLIFRPNADALIRRMAHYGADVNLAHPVATGGAYTPLMDALDEGALQGCIALLECGADIRFGGVEESMQDYLREALTKHLEKSGRGELLQRISQI